MLKIGWQYYEVEFEDLISSENNEKLFGIQIGAESKIKISTLYEPQRQEITFIHEVIHAIDEYMNIGLNEQTTDTLAAGIFMFLKDNRYAIEEYLKEERALLDKALAE